MARNGHKCTSNLTVVLLSVYISPEETYREVYGEDNVPKLVNAVVTWLWTARWRKHHSVRQKYKLSALRMVEDAMSSSW